MASEDADLDSGKNIDVDELLALFKIDLPNELTETEKALRRDLSSLKQMRRTLTDINEEVKKCERKEEKSKAMKPREKAKEEAMKLLKSGAISFSNKKERHVFKRKTKENEEEDTASYTGASKVKPLYHNFLPGPVLIPSQNLDSPKNESSEQTLDSSVSESYPSKRKQQLLTLPEEDEQDGSSVVTANVNTDSKSTQELCSLNQSFTPTLYVAYHNINAPFIRDIFKPYGPIVKIKVGEPPNHAYVTMSTKQMAEKALKLDHQMIGNRLLRVSFARKQFHQKFNSTTSPFASKYHWNRTFKQPAENSDQILSSSYGSDLMNVQSHEPNRNLVTYEDLYADR